MPKGDGNCGKGKGLAWIMAHLAYEGPDCLPWPYSRDDHGYGQCGYLGKIHKASRLMCTMKHGDPPSPEHHAAHSCGNGHQGCTHKKTESQASVVEVVARAICEFQKTNPDDALGAARAAIDAYHDYIRNL